ncbi:amidohydrolase family protein [Rhizobium rhizogenes]|uniref:amidohydrolase family protein n=1 Tax=Rhizobium rhizogenes TaxID=359 RepID=UPI00115CA96E|nr:amidohydrolase family protein [Rhizobium rhizogenes]QCL10422.1 amidohydrolase family protein [Rhizobium rhizogenes]TRB17064.1 hypothetical protein EXN70_31640 [Rhizobium rhizogenes]
MTMIEHHENQGRFGFPIIDVHTHTEFDGKLDKHGGRHATRDLFVADCRRYNIRGIVTDSYFPAEDLDTLPCALLKCAVIGRKEFDVAEIEDNIASGRFGAIKINLGFVPIFASDPSLQPIYAIAERHGIPILFHTGHTGYAKSHLKYSDPLTIDEVAVSHANVNFLLVHGGNPWFDTAAVLADKNPNVYVELSSIIDSDPRISTPDRIRRQIEDPVARMFSYVADPTKILFGSGWPMVDLGSYIEACMRAVPSQHRRAFFHDNACRLFNFSRGQR